MKTYMFLVVLGKCENLNNYHVFRLSQLDAMYVTGQAKYTGGQFGQVHGLESVVIFHDFPLSVLGQIYGNHHDAIVQRAWRTDHTTKQLTRLTRYVENAQTSGQHAAPRT